MKGKEGRRNRRRRHDLVTTEEFENSLSATLFAALVLQLEIIASGVHLTQSEIKESGQKHASRAIFVENENRFLLNRARDTLIECSRLQSMVLIRER